MTLITAQWSLIKTLPTPAPRPPAPAIGPSCARRSTLIGHGPVSINRPHRPCSAQQPVRLSHWKAGRVSHRARPFPPGATPPPSANGRDWGLPLAATAATHSSGPPARHSPARLIAGPRTPAIGHPPQAEARVLASPPSRWLPLPSVWSPRPRYPPPPAAAPPAPEVCSRGRSPAGDTGGGRRSQPGGAGGRAIHTNKQP